MYIDFSQSLLIMAEGMVGILAVVAAIYGCVELLMFIFKKRSKKQNEN